MKWYGLLRIPKAKWNGEVGMYNDAGAPDDVASALLCRVGPNMCATKEWEIIANTYHRLHNLYHDAYEYIVIEVEV